MNEKVQQAQTKMLRNSPRLIRDFWFEADKEEEGRQVLVIRQVKVEENGTTHAKTIRLTEWEVAVVVRAVQEAFTKQDEGKNPK